MYKILLSICTLTLLSSCSYFCSIPPNSKKDLNIYDSIQVSRYVKEKSDCDLINYIESNKIPFHNYEGYSSIIWNHLRTKKTTRIFITIATGNQLVDDAFKNTEMDSIVLMLKNNYNCDL